jgi:cobalt/nickel transport protein
MRWILGILVALGLAAPAFAHFQLLIPSAVNVSDETGRTISLDLRFTHPMAGGPLMNMAAPVRFGVMRRGSEIDLRDRLQPVASSYGKTTFSAVYTLEAPGDHVFFVEPARYWEAAEGTYIVHFTKVVVDGFNGGGGWDKPVGFPVEIMPLVRPYGLWTGNAFRGVLMRDGKPVPGARVEVEYLNDREPRVKVPSSAFETQVILTAGDGAFSYTMPRAGWWGFAGLVEGPAEGLKSPEGGQAALEWGALMWVNVRDME